MTSSVPPPSPDPDPDFIRASDLPEPPNKPDSRQSAGPKPHRGPMIIALSVTSFFLMLIGCATCTPIGLASLGLSLPAVVLANRDLADMKTGARDPSGRDATTTGMYLGVSSTLFGLLAGAVSLVLVGVYGGLFGAVVLGAPAGETLAGLGDGLTEAEPVERVESGMLTSFAPMHSGMHCDRYELEAGPGWTIDARMASQFDNYLFLEMDGMDVMSDDDSGGSLNAHLTFRSPGQSEYAVYACALSGVGSNGAYTLNLRATP